MAGPLLLSDNLYNTIAYPGHVITADEQATGHEIQNIADGRRSQYDYYTSVTANTERTLKVQCDIPRAVNTVFLDRGHNLTDKSFVYEDSANGSSWTTRWTFCPTGSGSDLRVGNYCLQSQAWATSPWSTNLLTPTNNEATVIAPDGTLTSTHLVPTAVNSANHNVQSGAITITSAEFLAVSVYLRGSGYPGVLLEMTDNTANSFGIVVGLLSGAILGSVTTGAGVLTSSRITALANSWYRVEFWGAVNGGVTSAKFGAKVFDTEAHALAQTSYTGDAVNGISAWGAQVERYGATATAPKAYTRTVAAIAAGAITEDGAWGYTWTALSAQLYHRLRIPAMGTGLVPVIVGAWLGTAYQPAFLYMPSSDDGATFTRPGNMTEWGWRGGGPSVVTRDGTLNIKFDSTADYTTARLFLVKQFAAGRPMWICHDQAQADRTILAMFPDGARIDPRFDSGWFPRQVQLPYAEHEPRRP